MLLQYLCCCCGLLWKMVVAEITHTLWWDRPCQSTLSAAQKTVVWDSVGRSILKPTPLLTLRLEVAVLTETDALAGGTSWSTYSTIQIAVAVVPDCSKGKDQTWSTAVKVQSFPLLQQSRISGQMWLFGWALHEQPEPTMRPIQMAHLITLVVSPILVFTHLLCTSFFT